MKRCILFLALVPVLACAFIHATPTVGAVPLAAKDETTAERWKAWRADLDYLYEEIEKESTLRQILKAKGIDWKKIKKEADKRFGAQAKAFKKKKKNDPLAQGIEFYGILNHVVGQLRDSHAHVQVDEKILEGWKAAQPKYYEAGIELMPGAHGVILVSNTYPGRGSSSPLRAKGVGHDATYLESVDGVPAVEYFEERAKAKYEEEGWQSTYGRAWSGALNGLAIAEGEGIKLVFQTLEEPDAGRQRYLELPSKKRAEAFKSLKWKSKKVSLRATECVGTHNPHNYVFMAFERPEMTETAAEGVAHCRLPSGYGFVRYGAVNEKSREGLDQACKALADCPGLILDLRRNGGGGNSGIDVFRQREGSWDKPFAVLMGPRTMSAAETEIWELGEMRAAKSCNVRFFGRTTAGASGAKVRFELPSGFAKGQFVCRHWHGGRSTIEGNGVEPDEVVLQDLVELSLGIDSCIARAEEWLASQ